MSLFAIRLQTAQGSCSSDAMGLNMKEPKISIVIPAYNAEKELPRTLNSVLAQSYQNIEVVIVNDGSSDGTAGVIDACAAKDSRIKPIHKENGGVTSARLRGVAEATGEWIGFVDGDDTIEPWMYERLMKNAQEHDADISHCGYRMVLPSGKIRDYYGTGKKVIQDHYTGMKDLLEGGFVEPGLVNKLFRRELFGVFADCMDFSIRNTEDQLMNFYLFRQAKQAVFEDVCPYLYILRAGSAANAKLNIHQLEDPLKVKKILFRETEGDPELHRIVGSQLVRQLVTMATMDAVRDASLIAPVRKRARIELRGMLVQILWGDYVSVKFKVIALWTAIWPWSYGFVHRTYERIRGIDKLYEKE